MARDQAPRWRQNYDAIITELLEAVASPRRRRSWRARYGALVAEARAAGKLRGRARTITMIRVCRKINVVESQHVLPQGPRFDAECAMELYISRALPGRYKGGCAGCYANMALPEDKARRGHQDRCSF